MGHVEHYWRCLARYKNTTKLQCSTSYGMGFFWMPAENAAKENNLDPKDWTEKNISAMKSQLKKLGLSIDWDRLLHALQIIININNYFLELFKKDYL